MSENSSSGLFSLFISGNIFTEHLRIKISWLKFYNYFSILITLLYICRNNSIFTEWAYLGK